MKKKILAILSGIVAASITVWICEYVNHMYYPPPQGVDGADWETLSKLYTEHVKSMPIGAFISLWAGWMMGAFVGGFVSRKIDTVNWKFNSYVIAGVLLLFSALNMFMIPHPVWLIVITVVGYYPAVCFGSMLAVDKK